MAKKKATTKKVVKEKKPTPIKGSAYQKQVKGRAL